MSDIALTNEMQALTKGRQFDVLSGVIIHAGQDENGNDKTYKAGTTSGYVLEYDNPLATQETAYSVLAALRARKWRYQPFEASTAYTDPAVEIGDNITVDGSPSVVMSYDINHSRLMAPTLKAPYDEEIDHEFKYEPRTTREFRRESAYTRSRLSINQDEIRAEVTRASSAEGEISSALSIQADRITSEVARASGAESRLGSLIEQRLDRITLSVSSGSGSSTFTLRDGSTTLDTKTLDLSVKSVNISGKLTASQIEVTDLSAFGATVGGWQITGGNYARLFRETDTSQVRLNSGGSNTNAIVVATKSASDTAYTNQFTVSYDGKVTCKNIEIQGGSISIGGNFSVDSDGNLSANNGTFRGSVYAGNIQYGGNYGTMGGGGITPGTINTGQGGQLDSSGVGGVSGGLNFTGMENQSYTANWVVANHIQCNTGGYINGNHYGGWSDDGGGTHTAVWKSKSIASGVTVTRSNTTRIYVETTSGTTGSAISTFDLTSSLEYNTTIYYVGR